MKRKESRRGAFESQSKNGDNEPIQKRKRKKEGKQARTFWFTIDTFACALHTQSKQEANMQHVQNHRALGLRVRVIGLGLRFGLRLVN